MEIQVAGFSRLIVDQLALLEGGGMGGDARPATLRPERLPVIGRAVRCTRPLRSEIAM